MAQRDVVNGLSVSELAGRIKMLREDPELAQFKFRATHDWIDGAHSRTTIHDFYGAREEQEHAQRFDIEADEPPLLLGKDQAAGATEVLLHALASCLGGTLIYHATAHGIAIEDLHLDLEGEIDLRGFLGISDEVRRGFQNIRVTFHVKSDASDETVEQLCRMAQKYSPVFDSVTHEVPVHCMLAVGDSEQPAMPVEFEDEPQPPA